MKKKTKYFILASLFFVFIIFLVFPKKQLELIGKENCPFCDSKVLDRQKFYEDDYVIAMCTHKPIMPGHCLIIPKSHVERFELLSDAELLEIGKTIKKINVASEKKFGKSYLLLQKNGLEVGQSVAHLHFHYIPRKAEQISSFSFITKMFWANAKKPSSLKMKDTVENMKKLMLLS